MQAYPLIMRSDLSLLTSRKKYSKPCSSRGRGGNSFSASAVAPVAKVHPRAGLGSDFGVAEQPGQAAGVQEDHWLSW